MKLIILLIGHTAPPIYHSISIKDIQRRQRFIYITVIYGCKEYTYISCDLRIQYFVKNLIKVENVCGLMA